MHFELSSQARLREALCRPMRQFSILLCAFTLVGCISTPLNTNVPYGFDLNGTWQLIPDESDVAPDLNGIAERELAREKKGKKFDPASSISFVLQDFPVLVSDSFLINQDPYSMGVKYSNSFYREVNWGRQQIMDWRVETGWQGGELIIKMKRQDVSASETYALSDRNQKLSVSIYVKTPLEKRTFTRNFVKK